MNIKNKTKPIISLILTLTFALSCLLPVIPTALAAPEPSGNFIITNVSDFGDFYWYYGRTDSQFFEESLDISATTGWTYAKTAIGFGGDGGVGLTLSTTIPTGSSPAQRGSPSLHTWMYTKKTFDLPAEFSVDDITDVSGVHRIDDALVILINGVQVYRYNTNNNSREVMSEAINWGSYTSRNTDAVNRDFSINSNYDSHDTGYRGTSSPSELYDAASLTNLKAALKPGTNVITCVVGQRSDGSSDIWFDLQMNITTQDGDISTPTFAVTFDTDGGNTIAPVIVNDGDKAARPADPVKSGYTFKGWLLGGEAFDFNTAISASITLKADWEENVPEPILDVSYVTLSPGTDASKLNFSWHTAARANGGASLVRIRKTGGEATVYTGTSSASAATISGRYYNRVTVTGLEADTVYTYQLGDGNGNWSVEYATKTGSPDAFSYIVVGDPQIGSSGNVTNDTNNWRNTMSIIANAYPGAAYMAGTGDQIETSGTLAQYTGFFSAPQMTSLPFAICIGNHEGSGTNPHAFYNPPNADSAQNYWYRYGDTLFLVWNCTTGNAAGMRNFLTNAIAANKDATWRILNFHYDVYGQGSSHALSDGKTYRDTYVPVIDEFDIDVVFNGHDHSYSRSYPMKYSGSSSTSNTQGMQPETFGPDGASINPTGTVYFSLNSATGSKYYSLTTRQPYTAAMNQANRPNFSVVDMTSSSFTCTTYQVNANSTLTQIDTYTIRKTPVEFAAETLTIQPGADATSLNFNWYSDRNAANNASVVKIAKVSDPSDVITVTGTLGDATAGKSWHKASVNGLLRDTGYTYRVSNDGVNFSETYSFKTGAEGSFQFIAVGDPQLTTGNQDSDSVWPDPVTTTKAGWQDTLNKISQYAPNARFIAGTGDQIDTATDEAQYTNYFAPEQLRSLPVSPAVGNHEGSAPNFGWHLNIPNETDYSSKPDALGNYWYTYNNALFVVLNTAPYPGNAAEAAPYIAIMDATLKAATETNPEAQWIFVQHHKSTASPASHQTDPDVLVWAPLFNALMDKYHVDFVLAGHDHVYSRSWVIKDGQKVNADYSGNEITNPKGTIYFTFTTASGLKYYDFLVNAPAAPAWVNDTSNMYTERKSGPNNINGKPWYTNVGIQVKAPQFTTVDVSADSVTFKTYRTDTMAIIDEYIVNKAVNPNDVYAGIHTAAAVTVNSPVEYAVSLSALTKAQVVTATFVADGAYLDISGASALGGFQLLGTPGAVNGITWTQLPDGFWQGVVKLMSTDNQNGVTTTDKTNVLTISGTARDVTGTASLKLTSVEITRISEDNKAFKLNAQYENPSDWEAVIEITERQPVFSIYDLNRDGKIDDEDLAIAWFYYLMTNADANWDIVLYDIASAKDADVTGDGVVDLADLIELLANYCASYNLYA